ncbi:MAG TPA: carbohydrate ABC transporter permease [Clostridiales bacterium]|nr:carbohydrate ABC transporter permease [Clostridiales bacterium]
MKQTRGEKIFQCFDIFIILLIITAVIFPLLNIFAISVSDASSIVNGKVALWPKGFNTAAYSKILSNNHFIRAMLNTILITVTSTFLSVLLSLMTAYGFTKEFLGKKFITYLYVLTMYFSGGLIPTYVVYTKYLHLRNNFLVLILPGLVSMFYIIIVRSQIESLPLSVLESAYIDGATEFQTAFKIVLPMISPTLAAIAMFTALGNWNIWFQVMIYTDYPKFWTLQYYLRTIVFGQFLAANEFITEAAGEFIPEENYRMAAIIIVAAPIVCIYPFVQKYFVKGIISGSVKG